ncbi:MAG: G1/S-specific cyclin-E1 [Marteilia pararefringens]
MSRIGRSSSGAGTYKSVLCCKNFDFKILGTEEGDIVDSCANKMESRIPDSDCDSNDHDYHHNKSCDAARSTDILSAAQRSLSANTATTKKNIKNTTQKSKTKSKRKNSLQTIPIQDPGTNYDNSTKEDVSQSAPSSPQEALFRDKMNLIREYHRNLRQRDKKSSKDPSFLDKHREINGEMRSILIDWLMEVCDTYSLHQDTFHLAIDITDRFMNATSYTIFRDQYQLLGITSLFVASKLEEIYPPTIHDFVYVTDSLYSPDDLKKQEKLIVESLKFDLLSSTIVSKYVKFYVQNFDWAQSNCSIADRGHNDDGNRENLQKQTTRHSNKTNAEYLVPNSKFGSDCSHTYSINTIEDITDLGESSQMLYPVHNEDIYRETMLLINLMILNVNCVKFRPSILALSAVIYTSLLFERIPNDPPRNKCDNLAGDQSAAFQYKRFDKKHQEALNSIKVIYTFNSEIRAINHYYRVCRAITT